ncbi:MAG: trypsin-like peptidase domain-containing protein [Pontiellaceae bacterium]|nr:trypsin-like peptidase domain-containing protein [Pontiellaceae bacterium]
MPSDSPSARLDTEGLYGFIGALDISADEANYRGSAVALSPHWVLSAGHNVDFNDDGAADRELSIDFYLSCYGSYAANGVYVHPDFSGFSNPSIQYDLSLLYFEESLPDLLFPTLGSSLVLGDTVTLVGFGRSGHGDYGYTTDVSLTDRRVGFNVVDEQEEGLFRYDFDDPDTGDGLGNELESIIGPGDSGGALLVDGALVGVNTFTEGYGGLFGDFGGGIDLSDEWDWINETTGLAIPEPSSVFLFIVGAGGLIFFRRLRQC